MSVAISLVKKVQLAKCNISVGFPKSSHIILWDKPPCVSEDMIVENWANCQI